MLVYLPAGGQWQGLPPVSSQALLTAGRQILRVSPLL